MKQGEILGERYKIIDILGRGGTSVVYLAENIVLSNLWAVKVLTKSNKWYRYEIQEVSFLKSLNHPMLPRIVDLFEDEFYCYIIMDHINGINLLEFIERNGKISEKQLMLWTRQLLELLSYLHKNNPPIIYRDMKPANIIMDNNGNIKLVDFGTARLHRDDVPEDTVYIGTQGYAAPEQYGTGQSDERTDLYNLGMTLLHLSTGIHPLKLDKNSYGEALKRAGISARLVSFILELTNQEPLKRPQNTNDALLKFERAEERSKPFFKEVIKTNPVTFRGVIGMASILPNTGLTSFSLMVGYFFKKQGYRVAIAELNASGDMLRLMKAFEFTDKLSKKTESSFEAEGIVFYPEIQDSSLLPRKGHDIVILDLGVLKNERVVRELNRSDVRHILCPNAVWKAENVINFKHNFESYIKGEWIYTLYGAQKQEARILEKLTKTAHIISFPLLSELFCFSKDDETYIKQSIVQAFELSGQKISLKH